MSSRDLAEFSALTFDCYGTLIDWETGIWDALQPLLMANPGCKVDRTRALAAFGEAETAEQTAHPETLYPGILAGVHRAIAARFDLRHRQLGSTRPSAPRSSTGRPSPIPPGRSGASRRATGW